MIQVLGVAAACASAGAAVSFMSPSRMAGPEHQHLWKQRYVFGARDHS